MNNRSQMLKLAVLLILFFAMVAGLLRTRSLLQPANTTTFLPVSTPDGSQIAINSRPPSERTSAIQRIIDLLQEIYTEADPIKRDANIDEWINGLAEEEITAMVEHLDRHPASDLHDEIVFRLFRKLAEKNPTLASQLAILRHEGPERTRILNGVAVSWMATNKTEAIAWARTLGDEERTVVLTKIAYESTATDPRTALELARELPTGDAQTELMTHVVGEWAAQKPQQIAEWATQITDEALRQQTIGRIAAIWGDTDPISAAQLALTGLPQGKLQENAVVGIVQRWTQNKPAEAAAWVAQFPEGKLRETATEEVVKLWSEKNLSEAGDWLKTLTPGPTRDAAANAYIGKLLESNPSTAANWVAQISDANLRTAAIERVASAWLLSDPAKAKEWINQLGLSDNIRNRLFR